MKKWWYRSLLCLLGIIGIAIQLAKYSLAMLLYYTILSNLLVVAFLAYMIYQWWTGDTTKVDSSFTLRIKGG